MIKGKKGIEIAREELIKWILWFFVAAALFVIVLSITIHVKQLSDTEKCRLSVVTRGKAKMMGKPVPINLQCYTRNIEIRADGAYLSKKLLSKFEGNQGDNVKRTIAEELYTCWYQFAKGEYIPFEQTVWFNDINHCVICSSITFDENLKNKGTEKVTGFIDWLKENKIPTTDTTYFEYLGSEEIAMTHPFPFFYSEDKYAPLKTEDEFSFDNTYSVVFLMVTPASLETWKVKGLEHTDQKAFLSVTKNQDITNPQSTQNFFCEKLY